VWEWRHDVEGATLKHIYGNKMDVFGLTEIGRYWRLVEEEADLVEGGVPCTVQERAGGKMLIVNSADPVVVKELPETIQEVLEEWGNGWMWKSLRMTGTDDWLVEAVRTGSLRAVTDGSYIKEMHPELCSAAFTLECSMSRVDE
jgi:hypothetical protein